MRLSQREKAIREYHALLAADKALSGEVFEKLRERHVAEPFACTASARLGLPFDLICLRQRDLTSLFAQLN